MVLLNQKSFNIDLIDPNPWQTRQEEDQAHIDELARSILANGLMQVPSGRTDENAERVQLAFGHSRLAAFRLLVQLGHDDYREFPVNIHSLTDEQMAIAAFAENEKRRDLNPVERARAIERMLKDFEWTQQQVAEKLQVDRSSISNALRMLRMPADVLDAVAKELLPVRSAMSLLPYYELTELELYNLREKYPDVDDFISIARQGQLNSDVIRKRVDEYMDYLHPVNPITLPSPDADLPLLAQAEPITATDEETPLAEDPDTNGPVNTEATEWVEPEPSSAVDTIEESEEADPDEDSENVEAPAEAVQPVNQPKKEISEPAAVIPVELVSFLNITWNDDGSAFGGYRRAGDKMPRMFAREHLTAAEFPEFLKDLGIE